MPLGKKKLFRMIRESKLTDFEKSVLKATLAIPKGKVASYKQIAVAIGKPNSYRAVGNALSKNPFAPMVPCHRVVRSDGGIGGYSAPGRSERKLKMLKNEGAL
ncbi:MAG: MGMT family protein [Candidatus Marsarchaeota archaeon]|jgi:methylated-DNA-[protein]-cysteine S-methyltransferase|nr:MGMT family protein [Candidatus Marsarchaeota archaeon]